MRIKRFTAAVVIAVGSIATGHFGLAADYDLSSDFSPTTNPSGVWSYGAKTNLDGGFFHYGIRGTTPLGGVPIEYWQLVASQEPTIYRNGTPNTAVFGSILNILPGTVWMFGGATSSPYTFGAVRFTVPAGGDGSYLIETDVAPAYDGGPQGDTDYHVVKNGAELFGQFLSPVERTGYTNSVVLTAGDALDFLVGRGQDNSNVGSGLKTRVKIKRLTPPPADGLVANGSFEMGVNPGISIDVSAPNATSITGWTVENANVDYIGSRWTAGDGVRCLDLSGTDAGTISQMIEGLTPGQVYRLSFLMAANPEVATYTARLLAMIGDASSEFTFSQPGITTANLGWTEKSLDFVASASAHKLSFVSLNPGWAGAALDKVQIAEVPLPSPLVSNGSFEQGVNPGISADVSSPNSTSITGWTVESGNIDYIGSRWTAGDGVRCLDLSGTDAGTISQMIEGLTPGQAYRLSFLMAANPEVASYTARLRAAIGDASSEFTFNQPGITTVNLGWREKTLDFVASASTHKLTFVSLNPGWAGAAIDNVAIVVNTNQVPEPPASVTYNLGRDFALANPNAVWSYGYQSAVGAEFRLMNSQQTVSGDDGATVLLWHFQSAPAIYANTNSSSTVSGGETYPPQTAWCYAGPEGSDRNFAVMRFTVPAAGAGKYLVSSAVAPRISSGGDDSDFRVAQNGVELFSQFLGATESGGYTNLLTLQSGDTIDFLVGRGANNRLFGSGLKVHVTIALQTNLPPVTPASQFGLAGDFSPDSNPNGVWTYGAKPSLSGPLSIFGIRGLNPFQYWQLVAGQEPTIYRNGTTNTIDIAGGQGVFPPGTTFLYSGTDGASNGFGVVRFTAPATTNYLIRSAVRPVYDGSLQGDTDYHVVHNGGELFGQFLAPAELGGYTNIVALNAGDVLDFMVGRGQDNSGTASGLKIELDVIPTSEIPPPPADGLVANGSFETGVNPGISIDVSAPNATSITGWTVENANVDYIGSRWTAGDGVRCLDLSGTDAGTISQMIEGLTPGQVYRLSFLMAANPEVATYTARLLAMIGDASSEFTFSQPGITTANLGWTEKSLDFVASESTHKLSFVSLNPGWAGAAIDKVAIVVNTNPPPINHAPWAEVMVEPDFMVWPDQTNVMVIAVDGLATDVILDGSLSSDEDGDVLSYLWAKDDQGAPFAAGAMVTNSLEVGFHTVTLIVDDGKLTGSDTVVIEVVSLEDALDELYGVLIESEIPRKDKRPLLATLDRVWDSIIEGRYNAAAKQLRAYQQKVRAQLTGKNAETGKRMENVAQQMIDAINDYLEHHDEPWQDDKGKGGKK